MELESVEATFKKELDSHFFPAIVRQQKSREFANLVQGGWIVDKCVAKLIEARLFPPHLISI